MRLLSWTVLVFLLSAGSSLADVDVNWVTGVVKRIRAEYKIKEQFCLAANIPQNQDPNTLDEVLQPDHYIENVKDVIDDFNTYEGTNVVVAKHVEHVHAEHEVLKNLRNLIRDKQGNFLLIYSYLSPCGDKCTNRGNRFNILKLIETKVLPNWRDYAFVFTKVFDKPGSGTPPTREDLVASLTELGNSELRNSGQVRFGLRNIFWRYKPQNLEFQCYSCSSHGRVSNVCIYNNAVPQQGGGSRSSSRGGSRSSSRGGSRGGSRSSSRGGSRGGSRSSSRGGSRSSSRGGSRSSRSSSISIKRARYGNSSRGGSRSSRNQGR